MQGISQGANLQGSEFDFIQRHKAHAAEEGKGEDARLGIFLVSVGGVCLSDLERYQPPLIIREVGYRSYLIDNLN